MREKHLLEVVAAIAEQNGDKPCNCGWAFEGDCRRVGCSTASIYAAEAIASYVVLPLGPKRPA